MEQMEIYLLHIAKKCLKIKVFAIECKNCAFYITLCYTNAEGGAMA